MLLLSLWVVLFIKCTQEVQSGKTPKSALDVVAYNPGEPPTLVEAPTPTSFAASTANLFQWEKIDFMPGSPQSQAVLVPWGSGSSAGYAVDLLGDYQNKNGWELVYNMFTIQSTEFPYFILYNKYRGLIRMYWSEPSNYQEAPNGVLAHKISIGGSYANSSTMLNFADQAVVDVQQKSAFASIVESANYPGAIATPQWQVLQFEIAYDPNISNQLQNSLSFNWYVISIKGNTPAGSLQKQGVDFTSVPALNGVSQLLIRGANEAYNLFGNGVIDQTSYESLTKAVGGFSSANSQLRDYNLNDTGIGCNALKLDVSVNYSWTLNGYKNGIQNMAVPGYDQTNTLGLKPNYNKVLGVFNLTGRPQIDFTKTADVAHPFTYSLNASTVKYVFNPEVVNIANIQNINQTIIATGSSNSNQDALIYSGQQLKSNLELNVIGVRVSFDVVPKDGSPKYTIVKTFKANVN